ncbi:MAG: methyltransferase domain-containing protein [Candidatus Eremiobacteraeota bacterium]|nr:methyltransferase domain-containing protein [Candidatus Eremiobacteraeota bacterium]
MRSTARELIDDPIESSHDLELNFRDIEYANRWFGGIAPVRRAVRRHRPATLLDIGSGSADIPRALIADARTRNAELRITCTDVNDRLLEIARARSGGIQGLKFERADGTALPYADDAFEMVTCNLALHHFDPPAAIALLREMRRVARRLPWVCDLRRTAHGFVGAWLWTRLWACSKLTRHDGPLSVRRAYTPKEALELAAQAGWRRPAAVRLPFSRMALYDA